MGDCADEEKERYTQEHHRESVNLTAVILVLTHLLSLASGSGQATDDEGGFPMMRRGGWGTTQAMEKSTQVPYPVEKLFMFPAENRNTEQVHLGPQT